MIHYKKNTVQSVNSFSGGADITAGLVLWIGNVLTTQFENKHLWNSSTGAIQKSAGCKVYA